MLLDIILKSLHDLQDDTSEALDEAAIKYPRVKFIDLLDLYDYLFDHGFKNNLDSYHKARIRRDSIDRFSGDGKQAIMDIDHKVHSRENGLMDINRYRDHLYWFLQFNETGDRASLTFQELYNKNDLERVKEAILNFFSARNMPEDEIQNLLNLLNYNSPAVKGTYKDQYDSTKNRLTLYFKVTDPLKVPIGLLKQV